jgi:hypothetical protein
MGIIRSTFWLAAFAAFTFAAVVFFKHGPADPTEFADGARKEFAALSDLARSLREHLPGAAPQS